MKFTPRLAPFYFKGSRGHLFCQCLLPDAVEFPIKAVLITPPLADEMNKSRRMLSQLAWKLAAQGYLVYLPDLYGTGDSEGNFSEATWEIWKLDLVNFLKQLANEHVTSVSIIAMRMGALLVRSILDSQILPIDKIVFWQPAINGELLLSQFLRLKLAADMIGESAKRITAADIKHELAEGKNVDIAGYALNPELASGLKNCKLEDFEFPNNVTIDWYEIVPSLERSVPLPSQKLVDKIIQAGSNVSLHKIIGAQFWATVELVDVPDLLNHTCDLFS